MSLVPVDTTNALAVSDYLDRARSWLATAVEMTGPAEIASARAEIATAAEAAKQLNLSKGIREDAVEMVRRAEYAVSRAIRKGQEDGTVRTTEESRRLANQSRDQQTADSDLLAKPSPTDIAPDF